MLSVRSKRSSVMKDDCRSRWVETMKFKCPKRSCLKEGRGWCRLNHSGTGAKTEVLPVTGQPWANDGAKSLLRRLYGPSLVTNRAAVLDYLFDNHWIASSFIALQVELNIFTQDHPIDLNHTRASTSIKAN